MKKFKARSKMKIKELDFLNIPHDEKGYLIGWYSDGYLLGDVVEVDEDYIIHEWWCKVDEDTVMEIE